MSDEKQAQKDKICALIAEGTPLRVICRMDGMPAWRTVYDWIKADEAFASQMESARALGYDAIAEETLDIADDARNDWMETLDDEGKGVGWRLNGDHVQRSKLRIETRLKMLAKWHPSKYGEKVDVAHGGSVGLVVNINRGGSDS